MRRVEVCEIGADQPGIFLRRWQTVDLAHDAVGGISLGNDQALWLANEMLGLEGLEWQRGIDHGEQRSIRVKGPLMKNLGALEFQVVTSRAAE